jgi:hypothetical protein
LKLDLPPVPRFHAAGLFVFKGRAAGGSVEKFAFAADTQATPKNPVLCSEKNFITSKKYHTKLHNKFIEKRVRDDNRQST